MVHKNSKSGLKQVVYFSYGGVILNLLLVFFNHFHDDGYSCFPKIQIDRTISQQRKILGVAHRLLQSQNVLLFAGRVHRFVVRYMDG